MGGEKKKHGLSPRFYFGSDLQMLLKLIVSKLRCKQITECGNVTKPAGVRHFGGWSIIYCSTKILESGYSDVCTKKIPLEHTGKSNFDYPESRLSCKME